jgi:hypothetical protein
MQMSGRKSYQLHDSIPIAIAEVPECQPQLQPTQALDRFGLGGESISHDGKIASLELRW